ncbi:MFS transporter [Streptomyces griseocarneus]|uniref:MFS transporter n=1 Tax=Streptomyces griseocarneus TaxID=51201 RepID=UPI00167D3A3C|nr:MFS transporter [Streptomyces griseocarneus]MBZ6477203.1 MFS transporter [Streptomyces griseocarneus]GHG54044.1 MFS transporter [Streptomyces griseocarneus]
MTNGLPRRFLDLLTRRHVAGPAWWSVVSRMPVYLMSLAMVLVVREQGGSYAQAGMVAALYTVGMAAGSPLVARYVDRRGRRPVLVATGLVYPSALAVLVWATRPGDWAQPLTAVVAGVALPPANACMRSLWARLPLGDEEREIAYLWEALLTEVLVIGAPLMLAALMLLGSAGLALTTVATVGGVGALGLALTPLPAGTESGKARPDGGAHSLLGPLREPALLALTGVMAVCAVPIGLMTLAIPAFVDAHGSPGSTGVVYACWGVGSAVGALWLGRSQSEVAVHRRFPRLVLAYAVGTALPLLAVSELTLGVALAVGSAPIALVSACEMTLVSTVADSRLLTEAFTWASLATVVGDAVGQQAGGLLVEPAGPHGVFAVASGVALAGAALAFACRGLLGRRTTVPARCAA